MKAYNEVLVNVATLLGADPNAAKTEMKDLIEFEMNLASVSNSDALEYSILDYSRVRVE